MRAVLVTGGTGSFGHAYVKHLLTTTIDRVVIYSRDELKQHDMRTSGYTDPRLRFFIGDVRDRDRLRRAMHGIDTVIHAAALKQVDTVEYNPLEAVKTNIDGTANVIDAALDTKVRKVMLIGTDKACDPTNLYGASKLAAEKLVVAANAYRGPAGPAFSAVRYGNVISSRGSVLPLFQAQKQRGEPLTITDPTMTRFVLTLDQAVAFVTRSINAMRGGEVFIPKLPAVTVQTIVDAVDAWHTHVSGCRPGEKHDELLVSQHEAHRTLDCGWHYLIQPATEVGRWAGKPVPAGFRFGSDTADRLDVDAFRRLAGLPAALEAVS